jgi:Zn-dependent protease
VDHTAAGIALFAYVAFLFSTVCHEAAHALAAKLGGDLTAYHAGQVTLSPIPHIRREPFGLGLLPLITLFTSIQGGGLGVIGFASAPFDPYWAIRHPRRAAWMAIAGPGANIALAAIALLALKTGIALGFFTTPESLMVWRLAEATSSATEGVAVFLSILYFENLLLAAWNLLPIPPMDGFSLFLFVLPASKVASFFAIRNQIGMMFPLLLFLLSGVFWRCFRPFLWFTVDLFFTGQTAAG